MHQSNPDFHTIKLITAEKGENIFSLNRDQIVSEFKQKGALLFRGFNIDPEAFCQFSETLGKDFDDYKGGAFAGEKKNKDGTLLSVTGGTKQKFGIPLHGEMYYQHAPPKLLWFYCKTPPLKHGETTVCNGGDLFDALKPETKKIFMNNDLFYYRRYSRKSWQGIFGSDKIVEIRDYLEANNQSMENVLKNSFVTSYKSKAVFTNHLGRCIFINNIMVMVLIDFVASYFVRVRLNENKRIPLLAYIDVLMSSHKLTYRHQWQKGDILLIDNTTVMHGRKRIRDNKRDIYVRLSDVNF
jgi:alpha-ketoglutarate-dependent taurine dioxygenase